MTAAIKARIKRGAPVYQDFGFGEWPACKPPGGGTEASDPDMEFECTRERDGWNCTAPGFGQRGDYGNGSIFVHDPDGIDEIGGAA